MKWVNIYRSRSNSVLYEHYYFYGKKINDNKMNIYFMEYRMNLNLQSSEQQLVRIQIFLTIRYL